jgi:hypothetical protein
MAYLNKVNIASNSTYLVMKWLGIDVKPNQDDLDGALFLCHSCKQTGQKQLTSPSPGKLG